MEMHEFSEFSEFECSVKILANVSLSDRMDLHIVEVDGKRLAITESCSKYTGHTGDRVSCSIVQIKD